MESNFNTLDFKMFDPVEAGEPWAVSFGAKDKVVEIYIDGKKLIDTIREIEYPYMKEEGLLDDPDGDYGHVSPSSLYNDLTWVVDKNGYADDFLGVYLFCCADCGEEGCWSVTLHVKKDDQYVYWHDFQHEHRHWVYNLTYKFEKEAYEKALQKLKNMSLRQRR